MKQSADQPPKLVIFVCDGVLVDTELIFNRVLHENMLTLGSKLSFEACCAKFMGTNRLVIIDYVRSLGADSSGQGAGQGAEQSAEQWVEACYQKIYAVLEKETTLIAGARDVLQALRDKKIPFCVASNGAVVKMQITLGKTAILPWFEGNLYSAYDIGQSKPAPDVFLHAAKQNGVSPAQCVVIEDSPSGMQAAKNAGMPCLAYCPADNPHGSLYGQAGLGDLFGAKAFKQMEDLHGLLGLA